VTIRDRFLCRTGNRHPGGRVKWLTGDSWPVITLLVKCWYCNNPTLKIGTSCSLRIFGLLNALGSFACDMETLLATSFRSAFNVRRIDFFFFLPDPFFYCS
jgi:hypothetical protein